MTVPIIPALPVNTVITIQPVTTAIPNRDQGAAPNPLASLASGTLVEGFVVNRDAQSNPILRTPLGDLRITSDVFLKTGSEVVFRVDTSQSSLARIVSVDGLTPQDYSSQSARGLTRDTITPSGLQAFTTSSTALGAGAVLPTTTANAPAALQAIVLQIHAANPAPTLAAQALNLAQSIPLPIISQLGSLRAGSPLRLHLLDVKLPPIAITLASLPTSSNLGALLTPSPSPASGGAPQTAPAAPSIGASGQPVSAVSLPPAASLPSVTPSAINTASNDTPTLAPSISHANLLSPPAVAVPTTAITAAPHSLPDIVSRPTSPAFTPPSSSNTLRAVGPQQFIASVIGHDADGANIVHTAIASLKIYTPQPLPTGTDLLVQIAPALAEDALVPTTIPTLSGNRPAAPLTQQLGVFGQLLGWLATHQPDVAQSAASHLPTIGPELTNGLLHFLVGIRSGDASEVISKRALQLLEVSNPEMLARLRQQVEQLQTGFLATPISQWNLLPIPLFFAGELHTAKLFIHQDPPEEENTASANTGRGQRFILEIETSQLGALQFDGFVRSHERGKSFDLMVRSSLGLPEDVSSGIRELFNSSLASTRLNGQIIFQAGAQHFVKPQIPASPLSASGINTILA